MRYKYLVLDLDNTLYPKQSGMLQYLDQRIDDFIFQRLNLTQTEINKLRIDSLQKYGTTLGGLIVNYQINPDEYIDHIYQVNPADFIRPDPELTLLIKEINLINVVFSNSPLEYVIKVLETLGVYQQIRRIYDIKFNNYFGKPNSSSYDKVLADLKSDGSDCIMIDDIVANVLGAKQSGMTAILLSQTAVTGIDWIIHDIHELKELVRKIQNGRISA